MTGHHAADAIGWAATATAVPLVAAGTLNENSLYILIAAVVFGAGKLAEIGVKAWMQINEARSKSAIGKLEDCEKSRQADAAESKAALARSEEQKERYFSDLTKANTQADRYRQESADLWAENRRLSAEVIELTKQTASNQSRLLDHIESKKTEPAKVEIVANEANPIPVKDVSDGGKP